MYTTVLLCYSYSNMAGEIALPFLNRDSFCVDVASVELIRDICLLPDHWGMNRAI